MNEKKTVDMELFTFKVEGLENGFLVIYPQTGNVGYRLLKRSCATKGDVIALFNSCAPATKEVMR